MHYLRKIVALFILASFISSQAIIFTKAESNSFEILPKLTIATPCAILIDAKTGNILFEKNSNVKMYPASITKIMTAILALENRNLNTKIIISKKAVTDIEQNSSNAGFLIGEELTLEQLLYALLLWSANEAANAIAEEVGGTTENFAKMMTKRAKELGAKNTNFVNANGLHDPNHYTTAYDMAIITRHAMSIPKFREIVSTVRYVIPPTNKTPKEKVIYNKNQLILPTARYYYKYAIGVKTGYTVTAGSTLVSAAKKGNIELIAVVLNSPINGHSYMYYDSIQMFEYAFKNFVPCQLISDNEIISYIGISGSRKKVSAVAENKCTVLIPKSISKNDIKILKHFNNLTVPVKKGDIVGYISFKNTKNNQELGRVNLIANNDVVKISLSVLIASKIKAVFKHAFAVLKWLFIVIAILFTLFIVYTIIYNKLRLKKKRLKYAKHDKREQ